MKGQASFRKYPDWVHWELLNWSRWSWEGSYPHPMPARACGSVEGEYTTPTYDSEQIEVKAIPAHTDRAIRVDKVWRALPELQRTVLATEYPRRHEFNWDHGRVGIARKLKVRLTDYEDALFSAVEKVWREFEKGCR